MSYSKLKAEDPEVVHVSHHSGIRWHLLPSEVKKGRFMAFHDSCATSSDPR